MKSGLEGRNNAAASGEGDGQGIVSMKSGLEGRNNRAPATCPATTTPRLNEVRPRRPEQWSCGNAPHPAATSLNEVRPRRPEQYGYGRCRVGLV